MTAPLAGKNHMEVASTTNPADIVEIDPEGDTVVKVGGGAEGRLMRVSIKTLSLASEVFKVMLGPNWIEGQGTHSAERPLTLPEDDPQAMEILFKLAHFKIRDPDEIPVECLTRILLACDKYGYFDVFRRWLSPVKERFYRIKSESKIVQDLLDGVCIAHMFDDSNRFSICIDRLYHQASENDITALIDSGLCTIMSAHFQDGLIAGLKAAMNASRQTLLDKLKEIVHFYVSHEKPCIHTVVRLGHCYRALWLVEQKGYTDAKPNINATIFRARMEALTTKLEEDNGKVGRCKSRYICDSCRRPSFVEDELRSVYRHDVLRHPFSLEKFKKGDYSSGLPGLW